MSPHVLLGHSFLQDVEADLFLYLAATSSLSSAVLLK